MKIAAVQMDVTLGDVDGNLGRMLDKFAETRKQGAELTIFPECALTGYCFDSAEEALPYAQPIESPRAAPRGTPSAIERFSSACRELGGFALFGLLEPDGRGGVFNAAALVGAEAIIGSYRKVHLPYLGIDRYVSYGDRPFQVHDVGGVRLGVGICYDSAFPEASRTMALAGADLIALPTNFPSGAECMAEHVVNVRAMENGVYFAAVNRVGTERGFTFIGRSRICAPSGETLAAASKTDEEVLYAEIDVEKARTKRVVRRPGHEIDRLADRRPEMYAALVEPHSLPRSGGR
ncbi:MAG: carbon-nitrogen hydrolase family protein [Planctomycetaceae bacterium]